MPPGREPLRPTALNLLHHPNPDVRARAIDTLGKVAGHRPDVAEVLSDVARDDHAGLRGMARHRVAGH